MKQVICEADTATCEPDCVACGTACVAGCPARVTCRVVNLPDVCFVLSADRSGDDFLSPVAIEVCIKCYR